MFNIALFLFLSSGRHRGRDFGCGHRAPAGQRAGGGVALCLHRAAVPPGGDLVHPH